MTTVTLRDVAEADLAILFDHQQDPEACAMAAFKPRDQDAFHAHWAKILADDALIAKAILFNGQVVGSIVSFERGGKRQVGYWIGREHWGRGIATAALREFLRHEPARPLHALVAVHNLGSRRVLEKCGFIVVGQAPGPPDALGNPVEEVILLLGVRQVDIMKELLQHALSLPDTLEGIACKGTALESVTVTVRGKAFLFVGATELKVKLGDSLPEAIKLAKKDPAHYQVGVHGWVTVAHSKDAPPPFEIMKHWIDESYRLLAPKKPVAKAAATKAAKKKAPKRR